MQNIKKIKNKKLVKMKKEILSEIKRITSIMNQTSLLNESLIPDVIERALLKIISKSDTDILIKALRRSEDDFYDSALRIGNNLTGSQLDDFVDTIINNLGGATSKRADGILSDLTNGRMTQQEMIQDINNRVVSNNDDFNELLIKRFNNVSPSLSSQLGTNISTGIVARQGNLLDNFLNHPGFKKLHGDVQNSIEYELKNGLKTIPENPDQWSSFWVTECNKIQDQMVSAGAISSKQAAQRVAKFERIINEFSSYVHNVTSMIGKFGGSLYKNWRNIGGGIFALFAIWAILYVGFGFKGWGKERGGEKFEGLSEKESEEFKNDVVDIITGDDANETKPEETTPVKTDTTGRTPVVKTPKTRQDSINQGLIGAWDPK